VQAATFTLINCDVSHNLALGGAGVGGGSGGNGLGGGLYNDGSTGFGVSALTATGSTITLNEAISGQGDHGGSDGQGIGGGLYLAAGGSACLDVFTVLQVKHNHASTSNDDLLGEYTIC
jgi:hypothetical protein